MGELSRAVEQVVDALRDAADTSPSPLALREIGTVLEVTGAVARVRGLQGVRADELIAFSDGTNGLALNLDPDEVGVILLGAGGGLNAGERAYRTGRVADVPVGEALLGRTLSATGEALDKRGPVRWAERWPIERPAAPIIDRQPVTEPLETGIKIIDALLPIGRGQRELVLGDRQTGKTALAVDAIINQAGKDVLCVYCAIGQRDSSVAQVIARLQAHDASDYTVVVVAGGEDPPGLQFITPYAATAIAEYFMERGRDVLIVYDDLTRHARAYRELSLLLRRPPGREAYPGDIFYAHARLLERSTHLSAARGGGSLTAIPIIETEAQNLTAYIPTNLISITDGQIYLSPELFHKAQLPAIEIGKSVSRVGGKAQLPAFRSVTGPMRLAYAQFEELEVFARFGTRLDRRTQQILDHGERVREIIKQAETSPLSPFEQIVVLLPVVAGVFDSTPLDQILPLADHLRDGAAAALTDVAARIREGQVLRDEDQNAIVDYARRALDGVHGSTSDADA